MLGGEDITARGRLAVLRLDKTAQSFEDALYVSGGAIMCNNPRNPSGTKSVYRAAY